MMYEYKLLRHEEDGNRELNKILSAGWHLIGLEESKEGVTYIFRRRKPELR